MRYQYKNLSNMIVDIESYKADLNGKIELASHQCCLCILCGYIDCTCGQIYHFRNVHDISYTNKIEELLVLLEK